MADRRDEFGDRTQMPTKRRLAEARRRGQVARSADLMSAAGVLGAIGLVGAFGGRLLDQATRMMATMLDGGGVHSGETASLGGLLWSSAAPVVATTAAVCLGLMLLAVLTGVAQVGLRVTAEPIRPLVARISPAAGIRRLFSLRRAVQMGLSICKIAAVAAVAWTWLRDSLPAAANLARLDPRAMASGAGEMIFGFAIRAAAVLAVLAAVDYLYQRWQHVQDLKMSVREVREDLKRTEGDPAIRSRRLGARKDA